MKSRAFCCNGALLRRDLSRATLLWGAYLLLWFVAMPANILSDSAWSSAMDLKGFVLELAAESCHAVNFFYGAAAAWFLFTYLNKSRSANFFGALPLRRESQFLTHYLSGILCSLVPNFLISGLTMVFGAFCGANLVLESAIWFATMSLTYLFYYSFAVLCAMLVGHLIAMPVLYLVLNFAAVVLETMVLALSAALIYGINLGYKAHLDWLSPFYYFVLEGNGPDCKNIWNLEKVVDHQFTGWTGLLIVAAVGLVLSALAFFCYKHRRMEAAGDVMAIRHLKPVFLYVFTFGCTLVIGTFLSSMLARSMDTSYFGTISVCLLVSAVLGFFLGQMILAKSLRVFGRGNFLRCLGVCGVAALILLGCRMDVLGVAGYVPAAENVVGVKINSAENYVEDSQRILETVQLHEQIVQQQRETERLIRMEDSWQPSFEITYRMADGSEISRSYRLPILKQTAEDPESLIRQVETLINMPEMIIARNMPADLESRGIVNCMVYYSTGSGNRVEIDPTNAQTRDLLQNAIMADMQAGKMGLQYHTAQYQKNLPRDTDVSVEIQINSKNANEKNYYWYSVTETATRTIAALQELGVPAEAFTIKSK